MQRRAVDEFLGVAVEGAGLEQSPLTTLASGQSSGSRNVLDTTVAGNSRIRVAPNTSSHHALLE